MALEVLSDLHSILGLLLDPEAHRLCGLQLEVGDHGGHDVSVHVLDVLRAVVKLLGSADDGPAVGDVVAIVKFGRGLQNDVSTVIDGAEDHRRGEGGIDDMDGAVIVGEFGDGVKINKRQHGVSGGLGENLDERFFL